MPIRYHIALPDPKLARGTDPELSVRSHGADGLAAELEDALRGGGLFDRWRGAQEDPDDVDPALAATDPGASVVGEQHDLHIDLIAVTSIPGAVLRHRLRLLAGNAWELRDVSAA